jgi:phosphoribosylamine--glycine ligase
MKILLVGGGGREHALAWKFSKSPALSKLFLWPGNSMAASYGALLNLPANAPFSDLKAEIVRLGIDAVICGPEQPLSDGIVDALQGIPVFGPCQAAAALESSKSFAKEIMQSAKVPTAAFLVAKDREFCRTAALKMLKETGGTVLKASGLAAGKGVFVCKTAQEVEQGLERLYGSLSQASKEVVIEEILEGRECSYFTFIGSDGPSELCFAVDHKRLQDGDVGPNTGGMGCYSPVPWLPEGAGKAVEDQVVLPVLKELQRRGITYTGILYVGLMWGEKGPKVVEFNVRFGDPECEVLALSDKRDWLSMILNKLGLLKYSYEEQNLIPAVSVVMASGSYPYGETEEKSSVISLKLLEERQSSVIFASSIGKESASEVRTGKGRVFVVTARGATFKEARKTAYERVEEIRGIWPSAQVRKDIGASVE